MDDRGSALLKWLQQRWYVDLNSLKSIAGDASFRRYFRVYNQDSSAIAVDAPPEKEDSYPFIKLAQAFASHGVIVPNIIHYDLQQGFMLVSDLGDRLFLKELNAENADQLYRLAIDSLINIQTMAKVEGYELANFDQELMQYELNLFYDWFLQKQLGLSLTAAEQQLLQTSFQKLIDGVLLQPRVCVHRDYHSRNLLVLEDNQVGVIDFQDAVMGPVSYDLVSLLKDCYINWPREKVLQLVNYYLKQAENLSCMQNIDHEQFINWFDWMGVQRHLKAIGIFSRLNKLYNKPNYLQDIPRTLGYILDLRDQLPQLKEFYNFLNTRVLPKMSTLDAICA